MEVPHDAYVEAPMSTGDYDGVSGWAEGDGHGLDLVLPFVVCVSAGGPYDDEPFVAGFEAGMLHAQLALGHRRRETTVHAGIIEQLDRIAMLHGYTMEATPTEVDGWTRVVFTLQPSDLTVPPTT